MEEKPRRPLLLHEILKEDQEPFHLKTMIAKKQSQLKLISTNLCFLSFAASPIQKKPKPKPKNRAGLGLLGLFLKRLKDRSKNRKRAIEVIEIGEENNKEQEKSLDLEASSSSGFSEFCTSPFTFSFHQSPSSTGRRKPELDSPCRQEKENSDNNQGDEEEEKEQCSPVSVLDPPFDEDDERENGSAKEEDEDEQGIYMNVQRAKQQLMQRLRRFEKLAELDPVELEKKLQLEGSDEEVHVEQEGDEPLSADMKRLVSDLIDEEKKQMVQSGGSEVMMGRICNRLDSWKEVEFDTIDMMIGLDFKKEFDGWIKHGQQVHETKVEIEVAIYLLLIQEIIEEFC